MLLLKLSNLIVHIIIVCILFYVAYAILGKKPMPVMLGVVVGLIAVLIMIVQVYFFTRLHECKGPSMRGLSYDPDDPDYDPIKGVGGLGWL